MSSAGLLESDGGAELVALLAADIAIRRRSIHAKTTQTVLVPLKRPGISTVSIAPFLSASAMTPEEIDFLRELGYALQRRLALVTTFSVFYGIFVLLFSITTTTFIHRGLRNKLLVCTFLLTILTFLVASAVTAASIAGLAIHIKAALVENIELPVAENTALTAARTQSTYIIQEWTTYILPFFADLVIIWRAYVICDNKSKRFLIPSLGLLLGSVGTTLTYLGFVAKSSTPDVVPHAAAITLKLGLALSLASNLVATLVISMDRKQEISNHSSPAFSKSFFIFVESGAFFACLQIVYLALHVHTPAFVTFAADLTYQVYTATYFSIAALYPTIVISIVIYQRSLPDMLGRKTDVGKRPKGSTHTAGTGARTATAGHLSFNVPLSRRADDTTMGTALTGIDSSIISAGGGGDDDDQSSDQLTTRMSEKHDDEKKDQNETSGTAY